MSLPDTPKFLFQDFSFPRAAFPLGTAGPSSLENLWVSLKYSFAICLNSNMQWLCKATEVWENSIMQNMNTLGYSLSIHWGSLVCYTLENRKNNARYFMKDLLGFSCPPARVEQTLQAWGWPKGREGPQVSQAHTWSVPHHQTTSTKATQSVVKLKQFSKQILIKMPTLPGKHGYLQPEIHDVTFVKCRRRNNCPESPSESERSCVGCSMGAGVPRGILKVHPAQHLLELLHMVQGKEQTTGKYILWLQIYQKSVM